MKLFITAVAALLMSAPAFAGHKQEKIDNTTWQEIESQRARYFVDAQIINFKGSNGGTFYKRLLTVDGATAACVYGDQIYGGTSKVCKKWKNDGDDDRKCTKYVPTELWAPISGTRRVCVDRNDDDGGSWQCEKWLEIDYTIDTNTKAAVFHQPSMDDDNRSGPPQYQQGFLGFKRRQLPNCSN